MTGNCQVIKLDTIIVMRQSNQIPIVDLNVFVYQFCINFVYPPNPVTHTSNVIDMFVQPLVSM